MRERVAEWLELAEAAQREAPGWWVRLEDQARRAKGKTWATPGRTSVASHVVASHEAVPAMASMLERAAKIIAAGEEGSTLGPDAAAWLREWRGE